MVKKIKPDQKPKPEKKVSITRTFRRQEKFRDIQDAMVSVLDRYRFNDDESSSNIALRISARLKLLGYQIQRRPNWKE